MTVYVWSLCPFFPPLLLFLGRLRASAAARSPASAREIQRDYVPFVTVHMCALGHLMRKGHEVRGRRTRSGGAAFCTRTRLLLSESVDGSWKIFEPHNNPTEIFPVLHLMQPQAQVRRSGSEQSCASRAPKGPLKLQSTPESAVA